MNTAFSVFDKQTGKVKRWGECPETMWEVQANDENEISLNVPVNADTQMLSIIDGVAIVIDKPKDILKSEADVKLEKEKNKDLLEEIINKKEEILLNMALDALKKK